MRLHAVLDDLFRARSHVRVLRALAQLPEGWPVSAREIGRRAGVSHPTASKALADLAEQGLVRRGRAGHSDSFELARDHIAAGPVMDLFRWEGGVRDELISFLRTEIKHRVPDRVTGAWLFGSAADGEMTASSDLDVALLCSPGAADAVSAATLEIADALRDRFGNRLSILLGHGSLEEVVKPSRKGYRLWRQITEEGIPIIQPTNRETAPDG